MGIPKRKERKKATEEIVDIILTEFSKINGRQANHRSRKIL